MRLSWDADKATWQATWWSSAIKSAGALLDGYLHGRGGTDLPESERDRYMHGECATLAAALHALTGWPVVLMGDGDHGCVGWVHAGVSTPSSRVLDAAGDHDPMSWIDSWGVVVDAYGEDLDQYCGSDVQISRLCGSPFSDPRMWRVCGANGSCGHSTGSSVVLSPIA